LIEKSNSPADLHPEKLLSEDHHELDQLLVAVKSALEGNDARQIYSVLDLFWARLAMHIRAEHLQLFPSIVKNIEKGHAELEWAGIVDKTIDALRDDHDFFMHELANAIKMTRELQREVDLNESDSRLIELRHKLATVSARLEKHNVTEEKIIYPLPHTLLAPAERSALANRIGRELENMPQRFDPTDDWPSTDQVVYA